MRSNYFQACTLIKIVIIAGAILFPNIVEGQYFQRATYSGLELSLGVHGLNLKTYGNDHALRAITRGTSIGILAGNNIVSARIRPIGYYTSTPSENLQFSVVQSEGLINFHPLEFFRTRPFVLDFYFTTGFNFSNMKISDADSNVAQELVKKQVSTISQLSGVGVMYRSRNRAIQLFSEALICKPLYVDSNALTPVDQMIVRINFGVRVCKFRNVKVGRVYPG